MHFFGVGIPAVQWKISKDAKFLNLPKHLKNQKLIKGFGWSDALQISEFEKLTQAYPDKFFCLSYFDGHKSFVSKNLIKHLNFSISQGTALPSGALLSEVERDEFYKLLPKEDLDDLEKMAMYAQDIFKEAGVKKVRHLTANSNHWAVLQKLEKENKLNLEIEVFFSEFMGQSLNEAANAFKTAQQQNSEKLKASGLKLFYDGSFGSSTAYTSIKNSTPPRITKIELEKKMRLVLIELNSPVAIHTIGDLALNDAIEVYSRITCENNGSLPTLHLEHAPIFSEESLKALKQKKLNCIFHFQPSHWIDDQNWYRKNKSQLGEHRIYPFDFLKENNYSCFFGSDAPVVKTSKAKTLKGLELIKEDQTKP